MGFDISIVASSDKKASSVQVTGSEQHVITDEERVTFGVGDHQLKQAVASYFDKAPNDAYLHSPTPWGDLYKTYSWPQVQTVVVVDSAEIVSTTSKLVALKTQTFANNSSHSATFNVGITESVTDSTSSNWTTGGTLTVGQMINYNIGFLGTGGGGETSLSYSQSWGTGGEQSKAVTLGSSSGVSVVLKPGHAITATLSASRGVMKVRIRYSAYLTGSTAMNYNPTFKGHHFWALPIGSVMSSAGISNSVVSTEEIDIDYYSNSRVEILNNATKECVACMIPA